VIGVGILGALAGFFVFTELLGSGDTLAGCQAP